MPKNIEASYPAKKGEPHQQEDKNSPRKYPINTMNTGSSWCDTRKTSVIFHHWFLRKAKG
jgi:hypothetical protein